MISQNKELAKCSRECVFTIYLLQNSCAYSVYWPHKKKYIYFEDVKEEKGYEEIKENLRAIDIELEKKTTLYVQTERITLIPKEIFSISNLKLYFRSLVDVKATNLWYEKIDQIGAFLLYTIPDSLLVTVKKNFSDLTLAPIDKLVINSAILCSKRKGDKLHLNFEESWGSITYVRDGFLYFYKNIYFNSEVELLEVLLTITNVLNINEVKIPVVISGKINIESKYIREICSYFSKVSLAELSNDLNFTHDMKHIPQHYFYNLFNAPLCV